MAYKNIEDKRMASRRYYTRHRDKRKEENKQYRLEHRDYFRLKGRNIIKRQKKKSMFKHVNGQKIIEIKYYFMPLNIVLKREV